MEGDLDEAADAAADLTTGWRCFWQVHVAHFGNLIWPTHD